MANSWLRLWHDMPNDPKWRTIARVSKQPISAVLAVYIHLLVIASNATERGRTQNVCSEDLASALDLDTEQIDLILSAMQGRVLDGDKVSGWSKRQVEREDGSAERAKRWRKAQKEVKQTQPNATERDQTPDTDTDTDTDKEISTSDLSLRAKRPPFTKPTIDEIRTYCHERGNDVDPEKFYAHYTSNGWKVGRNPMKDWKAAIITWEKSGNGNGKHETHRQFTDNSAPARVARANSERRRKRELDAKQTVIDGEFAAG